MLIAIQFVQTDLLEEAAIAILAVTWVLFGAIFIVGRSGAAPNSRTRAKSNRSWFGFALQMIGYSIVFGIERDYFTPIVPMPKIAEVLLLLLATGIGLWSVLFCFSAARTLGKQWSLAARVIVGHELIEQGPFAVVRNPIYLAMLGLLIQAGIVLSIWQAILPAVVAFLMGTYNRIDEEEKILREEFGAQFDDYARRVPSFLPKIGSGRG
jgi:protein-S-isoprenylcysteine O-methyltransferase Ste14